MQENFGMSVTAKEVDFGVTEWVKHGTFEMVWACDEKRIGSG